MNDSARWWNADWDYINADLELGRKKTVQEQKRALTLTQAPPKASPRGRTPPPSLPSAALPCQT